MSVERAGVGVASRAVLVKWDGEPPPDGQLGEPAEVWEQDGDGAGWHLVYARAPGVPILRMMPFPRSRDDERAREEEQPTWQ